MNPVAKFLVMSGVLLVVAGLFCQAGVRFLHFGRLPGDVSIDRGNFRFYSPIGTSIVISLILTLLLNLYFRFFGK